MNLRNSRTRLRVLATLMIPAFLLCYSAAEKSKSTTSGLLGSPVTLQADGGAPLPPPPPPPVKQSQSFTALA
jgi:hypothetical protein